jgi:hypothetical protein
MSERKQIEDGGPAFPRVPVVNPVDAVVHCKGHEGMTLRDWFAGQETLGDFDHPEEQMPVNGAIALAGPQPAADAGWEAHFVWNANWRAKLRYMRADAMITERGKK